MKRLYPMLRIVLGFLSLIVGLAGLVLPILQGWLFLAIGLVLLSRDIPFFRRLGSRLEKRFPWLARMREAAQRRSGEKRK